MSIKARSMDDKGEGDNKYKIQQRMELTQNL
jgi:hypothetical protein